MKLLDLWRWEGRVKGSVYLSVGVVAFCVKMLLDFLISTFVFHRFWTPLFYLRPFGTFVYSLAQSNPDVVFALTMLLVALPFVWLGLAMTVKRLRDAGRPLWYACFFFVPVVSFVVLLVFATFPSVEKPRSEEAAPWPNVRRLDGVIPHSKWGSALLSILVTSLLGLIFTVLGTVVIKSYGWGLFVALPFCLGLFSVLLHSYHEPRSFGDCVGVSVLPIFILGFVLLVVAIEGIICILMAAPIALALAFLGGWLGYVIQAVHWGRKHTPAMLSVVILVTPTFFGGEHFLKPQPGVFEVKSSIEVNAPPERVWQQVVAFAEIPPPQETIFRAGIAYPIRAEISGHGPGAVRHCIFSTGPFVEPITVWDEPRLLRFSVTANPAPMNELTPYGHIQPAHLHGYFESHQGQFLLTALPNGRTRLEGTTWYSHTMWPEQYWHWWSDYVIHNIHMRVLRHIKTQTEALPRH
jgi:uncharacterized membrane protein YhaH (DUF805 family)